MAWQQRTIEHIESENEAKLRKCFSLLKYAIVSSLGSILNETNFFSPKRITDISLSGLTIDIRNRYSVSYLWCRKQLLVFKSFVSLRKGSAEEKKNF
jgi:hypothetical protein